jgi:hypothetical protein
MVLNVLYIGIAGLGCISLLSYQVKKWYMLWAVITVFAAVIIWEQLLPAGPVAQLSPAIVVMFILPGFLVLELAFPNLAQKLGPLERTPLLFCLSMAVWTIVAAVAYRTQLSSDLVIGGVLVSDVIGLLAVFGTNFRYRDSKPFFEKKDTFDYVKLSYFICLILVLLIVSGVVGYTAQYQRYDFDSCMHLAGYNKIANSVKIIGGNPFFGPEYSYYAHDIASPWYLVFGLSARLGRTNVTWLYVCLAAVLTPLFFLSFYSLLKVLIKDIWIAVIGTLLVIGPWVSKMALLWGPPMGNFYLQFLPYQMTYSQLILFPIWLAYCFRYTCSQASEEWATVALLAFAAMGHHPIFLLVIPYITGLVFIVSMFFLTARRNRIKTFALVVVVVILAAIIAYIDINPVGKELWKGAGYRDDSEAWMKWLLNRSWIIDSNLYAMHPKSLITPTGLMTLLSFVIMSLFIVFQPKLFFQNKTERWLPALSISTSRKVTQWHLAAVMAAVYVGPLLVSYNPIIAPIVVDLLKSPVPIWYFPIEYEVPVLVCQFGAIASVLVLVLRCNKLYKYRKTLKLILLFFILIVGIGWSLGRPTVRSVIRSMVDRDAVSILSLTKEPLFKELSKLQQGVVAINRELGEYLVMTTPHYVVWYTRVTKARELDNEMIVKFSVIPEVMKTLLSKYNVRYIVVPLNDTLVSNGEFSKSNRDWDAVRCTLASVSGGQSGNCLQLTPAGGSGQQFAYQDITCDVGKYYEITGYVKSGTSGDEPFGIQILRHQASGLGEFLINGTTTNSWIRYSGVFKANYRDLCILLRKLTATPGTMMFDTISCNEVIPRYAGAGRVEKNGNGKTPTKDGSHYSKEFISHPPLQRFREHPELFDEILTVDKYAIFEVKNK